MSSRARLRCWMSFNRWSTVMLAANVHYTSCGRGGPRGGSRSTPPSTATAHRSPKGTNFLHSDPEPDQWQPNLGMCFAKEQLVPNAGVAATAHCIKC